MQCNKFCYFYFTNINKNNTKIKKNNYFFFFKPKNFKILYKPSRPLKVNLKILKKSKKFKTSNFFILSTNYGILTCQEAIKKKTGGFLIFKFF
jgi:ribosomal protein S8